MSSMDDARKEVTQDCEHPGEYLRMGDHPDMTGRFVLDELKPYTLYCLRCEGVVEEKFDEIIRERR